MKNHTVVIYSTYLLTQPPHTTLLLLPAPRLQPLTCIPPNPTCPSRHTLATSTPPGPLSTLPCASTHTQTLLPTSPNSDTLPLPLIAPVHDPALHLWVQPGLPLYAGTDARAPSPLMSAAPLLHPALMPSLSQVADPPPWAASSSLVRPKHQTSQQQRSTLVITTFPLPKASPTPSAMDLTTTVTFQITVNSELMHRPLPHITRTILPLHLVPGLRPVWASPLPMSMPSAASPSPTG